MAGSGYQILRLISHLRHVRGEGGNRGVQPAPMAGGADRVRLSEKAREQAAQVAELIRLPPGTPVAVASIVDQSPLPLATRIELERRAGSFMHPPQVPSPAPAPIPRARRPFPRTLVSGADDEENPEDAIG